MTVSYCSTLSNCFDEIATIYQVGENKFIIQFDDGLKIQYFKSENEAIEFLLAKGFIF